MAVKKPSSVETTPAKDAQREEDGPGVFGMGCASKGGGIEGTTLGDIKP